MVTCGWSKTLTGLCGAIDFFFLMFCFTKCSWSSVLGSSSVDSASHGLKVFIKYYLSWIWAFLTVLPKFCTSHKCPTCPPSLILALLMTGPAVQCTEKKIWSYIIFHFVCGHLYVGILYNTLNSFKGKDHNRVHIILITFTACLFIDRV